MNYIYTICLHGVSWAELAAYQSILPLIEQQKINQLHMDDDKSRSLLGKLLLLYILKKHLSYRASQLPNLNYNHYFKPFIATMPGSFNISHAGDWVVCAYSQQGMIGVDIEQQQPLNIDEYHQVLTLAELNAIRLDKLEFIQLWTLKEAIIKADGRGFHLAPNSFALPIPFINHSPVTVDGNIWFLHWQKIASRYALAIACSTPTDNTITKRLDIKQLITTCYC
ncbi:4'-phosphopantetheinyl transferase superfamily protein [Orbus sturtevantii]|uniref:4'-phosphopantetheinyl transferase family protein n=1 Tax=Orbus sturtevantii TaxID=3074109 RepID=UPI00370D8949